MTQEKEDLRILRTRKLLCIALFDLLQKKSFDKLTINDICDKAMVHRATFYNHFLDKNDLLNYLLDELQAEMFEKSIKKEHYQTTKEIYLSIISNMIDFITENKEKLALVFANSAEKMFDLVLKTVKNSIRYLLSKNKHNQEYSMPIEFIVNFYTGGITVVGIDLIRSQSKCNKEEIIKNFDILLNEDFLIKNSLN